VEEIMIQTYGSISWEQKTFQVVQKDFDSFGASLRAAIRALYYGQISYEEFLDAYHSAIRRGLNQALNEGAAYMGFDSRELNVFDRLWVSGIIAEQFIFIPALALAIIAASREGTGVDQFITRSALWQNKYNNVLNYAKEKYGGNQKLVWLRGGTKKPCTTCKTLNNVVALASEWNGYIHKPQSLTLECNGYQCKCGLYATNRPISKGGIPIV